jgi:hypothetical protein
LQTSGRPHFLPMSTLRLRSQGYSESICKRRCTLNDLFPRARKNNCLRAKHDRTLI